MVLVLSIYYVTMPNELLITNNGNNSVTASKQNNDETKISLLIDQFIHENVFHEWEDDEVYCFAFVNTDDGIVEYQINENLFNFIKSKIKEHYENI